MRKVCTEVVERCLCSNSCPVLCCPHLLSLTRFLAETRISWPHAAQQAKPTHRQVIHTASAPCNATASPLTFPCEVQTCVRTGAGTLAVPVRTNAIAKVMQAAWARCSGKVLPSHHFASKPGRTGKETTGKSRILGLMHSLCASQVPRATLYQAQSYLDSIKKCHFTAINLVETCL